MPWAALVAPITPHAPKGKKGRPPFPVATMMRIHFMQQWHSVTGTAANVNDVVQANAPLHGDEVQVFADASYQGAHTRPDAKPGVHWNIAMRLSKRRDLNKRKPLDRLMDQLERLKASVRAKVEHPFRVIKRQFGHVKVRYRGLGKNTAQLKMLFVLSNL